jgi:hypothetical protein
VADSQFRILATEVNTRLAAILAAEGRAVPEFTYSAARKPFKRDEPPVRVAWVHIGGNFSFETKLPAGAEPPLTPPLGVRVAIANIFIWAVGEEPAEHVLDRLWMATREIVTTNTFLWKNATYEFPSEKVGEDLDNGVSIIRLTLPIEMPVSAVPDVPDTEVTVEGHDWRAGTELPVGEDEEDSEYEVDRTDWQG